MRKRDSKQSKGLGERSSKGGSGLCGIVKLGLSHERQDQIINRSHDLGCVSNGHAGGIFLERDLAAIVQAGLNAPMGSAGQAGATEFYFTRSAVAVSIMNTSSREYSFPCALRMSVSLHSPS